MIYHIKLLNKHRPVICSTMKAVRAAECVLFAQENKDPSDETSDKKSHKMTHLLISIHECTDSIIN